MQVVNASYDGPNLMFTFKNHVTDTNDNKVKINFKNAIASYSSYLSSVFLSC